MANFQKKSLPQLFFSSIWITLGAVIAAYALEVFLFPNQVIDGGIIGISYLFSKMFGESIFYPLVIILNIPFIYLAYRNISKTLLFQMMFAVAVFSAVGSYIGQHHHEAFFSPYQGDLLEIVVIGGLLLGLGVGLIIRSGGCLDGTEILGLLINKKYSISVGTVVMAVNLIIFISAGFVFGDWHPTIKSLITFFIVIKIMDMVIVGLDEMKSVMIFSEKSDEIADAIMHDLGMGLTVLYGRGGFSGEKKEIIYLMAERLQLSSIKALVHSKDPAAFIAIENLHEVASNGIAQISNKIKK